MIGKIPRLVTLGLAMAAFSQLSSTSGMLYGQMNHDHDSDHDRVGVVSDWTHHHLLYPESKSKAKMESIHGERRWIHSWYARHPEKWWPEYRREYRIFKGSKRDWSVALGTVDFEPMYDFTFAINHESGFGSLNTIDQGNGQFLANGGSLTVTGINDIGTYSLSPGGPALTTSPSGAFQFDNLLFPSYPTTNPSINSNGLLFKNAAAFEVNLWGNGANSYEFDDTGYANDNTGAPFTLKEDPGAGQTFPAKYVFDVNAIPSCTNDFVAMGIPANPASGGQANLVGYTNLYTGTAGFCTGVGPTLKFAYASGTGQVPANLSLSPDGRQIAFVENLTTGSSYFHVLTIGTTGTNGTSATAAVVPGASGGNNAVDRRVLLSPDGGTTNQSSTASAFVLYTINNATDVAYVTTYNTSGSGYLYKLANVFNGNATPTIVWSVAITAIPSTPVYDVTSNKVFFTDSSGRIDSLIDVGVTSSVVYGSVLASGTTSENPVTVDSTNQMVYATFNSNGTNAIVVQAPTSLASTVTVPVGTQTNAYAGPYSPDFNNAFYSGAGTKLMYIAGTGSGTVPTLYGVGFLGNGKLNPASISSTPLATGFADASPVTEFFNVALSKDYIFVGVSKNCVATTGGGTAGCVMSLDITNGFPTVNAASTALAAAGGTTGIIVDNDGILVQQSNIYYATKTGGTLVKATQFGLN